jgi:sialate O-acetylesterase
MNKVTGSRFTVRGLVALGLVAAAPLLADLALAPGFGDHMVLQRDMAVPVWGTADAGARVSIVFAGDMATTTADADGNWRFELPAMHANATGRTLTVQSGVSKLELTDVLVGDVWVAAGQSNMEWSVRQSANAKAALAGADRPGIRLLHRQGAARGGSGVYTPDHIDRLSVDRFFTGSWTAATADTVAAFSAVAWYFGIKMHEQLKVPIGLIDIAMGGTQTESWIARDALAAHPNLNVLTEGSWLSNPATGEWCRGRAIYNLKRAMQAGEDIPGDDMGPNHSFKPSFCWTSGVEPLVPMAITGVLWYQGESNAETPGRVEQHIELFPLLVQDWRKKWKRRDLPFGFVQLPAMGRPDWPAFRETQRRAQLTLPNTGMAITMDVGHPSNVHPTQKQPVGDRLAAWALHAVHGRKDVVPSGPLPSTVSRDLTALLVEFNYGDGLMTADGKAAVGFEVAGDDGVFHPAIAPIIGKSVRVQSAKVGSPSRVRFGWRPYPRPGLNLVNGAGIPASPFTATVDGR